MAQALHRHSWGMTQALHRHWWEAAGTQKGGLASWAALAAAPVIGAAEQLASWSKQVCESWAAGWRGSCSLEPARLGLVHKRAVVLQGNEATGARKLLEVKPTLSYCLLGISGFSGL